MEEQPVRRDAFDAESGPFRQDMRRSPEPEERVEAGGRVVVGVAGRGVRLGRVGLEQGFEILEQPGLISKGFDDVIRKMSSNRALISPRHFTMCPADAGAEGSPPQTLKPAARNWEMFWFHAPQPQVRWSEPGTGCRKRNARSSFSVLSDLA